jgi:Carboxypeptidase regulatory-like domain
MKESKFDVNHILIASPCSARWDTMEGSERARHCGLCSLNVYNISEMTAGEVTNLIAGTEERVCARIYKRTDGTVLTKDCPVGIRAYYRKTARLAGLALSTLLGLFTAATAQSEAEKYDDYVVVTTAKVVSTKISSEKSVVSGRVIDPTGARIPEIKINLFLGKNILTAVSNDNGEFRFSELSNGSYTLKLEPQQGFRGYEVKNLTISSGYETQLDINLSPRPSTIGVVSVSEDQHVETTPASVTTTTIPRKLDKIPH